MASTTSIEWTNASWNPIFGCRKVSDGCRNCYAEKMGKRLAAIARADITKGRDSGRKANYMRVINSCGGWNGEVVLDERCLNDPLTWKRPRRIFVCSMCDLFYDRVPEDDILRVFDVMKHCEQHEFQVLTKRPERAAEMSSRLPWAPHIWMGTSIENDQVLYRIEHLRRTNAHIKFLSVEPLLGPIPRLPLTDIDWTIVGGGSRRGARSMLAEWVRQIRNRCISRDVRFHFKQWGKSANNPDSNDPTDKKNGGSAKGGRLLDGRTWDEFPDGARLS